MNPGRHNQILRGAAASPYHRLPELQTQSSGLLGVSRAQPHLAVDLGDARLATYEAIPIALHLPPAYANRSLQ